MHFYDRTCAGKELVHALRDLNGRDDLLVLLLPETEEVAAELVAKRIDLFITGTSVETKTGKVRPLVEYHLITSIQEEFPDLETMLNRVLSPYISKQRGSETIALSGTNVE